MKLTQYLNTLNTVPLNKKDVTVPSVNVLMTIVRYVKTMGRIRIRIRQISQDPQHWYNTYCKPILELLTVRAIPGKWFRTMIG